MKATPTTIFMGIIGIGAGLYGGSVLLSALGDAASQRNDAGVVGLFIVGLVVAAAGAAAVVAAFNRARDKATTERNEP